MKASIGKIAKELGVSRDTLRRWEAKGKITVERTPRGPRRYDLGKILGLLPRAQPFQKNTIAYARVSGHDQKADLITQLVPYPPLSASCDRQSAALRSSPR